MLFARKTHNYTVMYDKKKSTEMLLADERIKSVKTSVGKMVVVTNPITLKSEKFAKWVLGPIGTYTINVKYNFKYKKLDVTIKRNEGTLDYNCEFFLHFHIRDNWHDKICWGSAYKEVDIIRENKDWFWLVKRLIDLLEDGEPEYSGLHKKGNEADFDNYFISLIGLQASYAKKHKLYDDKLKKKLSQFWKKKVVVKELYNRVWLEVREWLLE